MAAASGQYGKVEVGSSVAAECTKWSFTSKANIHEYASCDTAGYKKAIAGTKSGSGTIEGIYDPEDPITDYFEEGDSVTLKLYVASALFYSIPAVIGEISLEVDIEEGDLIRWTAPFTADGAWSLPGA